MRDKERIYPFIALLTTLWEKYPDLRFGQLITIIKNNCKKDFFYMEEDDFYEVIINLLPERKRRNNNEKRDI